MKKYNIFEHDSELLVGTPYDTLTFCIECRTLTTRCFVRYEVIVSNCEETMLNTLRLRRAIALRKLVATL